MLSNCNYHTIIFLNMKILTWIIYLLEHYTNSELFLLQTLLDDHPYTLFAIHVIVE